MKIIIQSLLILSLLSNTATAAEDYPVIQVYTQDELNSLIKKNQHLQRVKADDCQLVQDIEAHALKIQEPSYVFLWGDMLAWGVCVERDATLGMYYIDQAAKQGLLAAIEQLGRYYNNGTLVIKDKDKATKYFREAALQGNLPAKISYIKLLDQGYGSPLDYEDAYRALNSSIIVNPKTKKEAERLLAKLAKKMPEYAITNARKNYND
ncbi:sel1 repeat family protein [Psychromonas sp. SP041]|uniref:tetratricopeptide repeat protein n=1 Tax=Psychromonas sp. SP041 TaxID=1365007 RepID=UPI00041932CB|nr:sel1 repeat family protein [Psychromonas sp. SP041]